MKARIMNNNFILLSKPTIETLNFIINCIWFALGYNRYNQYEERSGPKRREFEERRDFRERLLIFHLITMST